MKNGRFIVTNIIGRRSSNKRNQALITIKTTPNTFIIVKTHTAIRLLAAGISIALLSACTVLPRHTNLLAQWVPSPNFDARRANLVIIHHTGSDTVAHALRTLTTPERKVSAHYLIGRDGTILQLVDESARAWHAGKSWWGGQTDINSASLGIELDNDGSEAFAPANYDLYLALTALGYDPSIPKLSLRAFHRHFGTGEDANLPAEEHDKALAYCLLQKKLPTKKILPAAKP